MSVARNPIHRPRCRPNIRDNSACDEEFYTRSRARQLTPISPNSSATHTLLSPKISIYAIAAADGAITCRMSTRSDTLLSSQSIPLTVPLDKRFRAREEARDVNFIDIRFLNEISTDARSRS